jgi:hypothetical protein
MPTQDREKLRAKRRRKYYSLKLRRPWKIREKAKRKRRTYAPKWVGTRELMLYVLHAGIYTKVGIANDMNLRMQVFRTHCPIPLEIAYCSMPMEGKLARKLEIACHKFLQKERLHGEWFKTTPDGVISFIKSWTSGESHPVQLRLVV